MKRHCPEIALHQHCPAELSATTEIFYICAVQHESHWPCVSVEHLKCCSCVWGTDFFILILIEIATCSSGSHIGVHCYRQWAEMTEGCIKALDVGLLWVGLFRGEV